MTNLMKVVLIFAAFVVTAESRTKCTPIKECLTQDIIEFLPLPDYYIDSKTLEAFCGALDDYIDCVGYTAWECANVNIFHNYEEITTRGKYLCTSAVKKAVDDLTASRCLTDNKKKEEVEYFRYYCPHIIDSHDYEFIEGVCKQASIIKMCFETSLTPFCGKIGGGFYGRLLWQETEGRFFAYSCNSEEENEEEILEKCDLLRECLVDEIESYYVDSKTLAAFCGELSNYTNCVTKRLKDYDNTYIVSSYEQKITLGKYYCTNAVKKAVDALTASQCLIDQEKKKKVEKAISECIQIGDDMETNDNEKVCRILSEKKDCYESKLTAVCGKIGGEFYSKLIFNESGVYDFYKSCSTNQFAIED